MLWCIRKVNCHLGCHGDLWYFDLKTFEGDIRGSANYLFFWIPRGRRTICFREIQKQIYFLPLYSWNILRPFKSPNGRTTCRIWKTITFLEFLSQGEWFGILWRNIQAPLIFDPLVNTWDHFEALNFKIPNDAMPAWQIICIYICYHSIRRIALNRQSADTPSNRITGLN